jgi:hypothetical protein
MILCEMSVAWGATRVGRLNGHLIANKDRMGNRANSTKAWCLCIHDLLTCQRYPSAHQLMSQVGV